MSKRIGYGNTIPRIKEVTFPSGKIVLHLYDSRMITLPIDKFPAIAKLTPSQKRKYKTLAGMGLMFDDCDVVFHISDFLGQPLPLDAHPAFSKTHKNYVAGNFPPTQAAEPD